MKVKILTMSMMLLTSLSYAINKPLSEEKLKVKEFNFSNEINYEGTIENVWNEELGVMMYALPMKNSSDLLVTFKATGEEELTPMFFYSKGENSFSIKDLNNKKEVITAEKNKDNKMSVNYYEQNESYSFKKGCPGGSTAKCIKFTLQAIASDMEASLYCGLSGWWCIGAITAACGISCNM